MHPQQRRRKKRPPVHGLKTVEVTRGRNGYGFTISGQQPCILSCIVPSSPAERAGLRTGDFLMSVNGQEVSKMTHDDVVRLIGSSMGVLMLQIVENNRSSGSSDDEYHASSNNKQKAKYPNRSRPRQANMNINRSEKVLADLHSGALFTEPQPALQGATKPLHHTRRPTQGKHRSHSPDVERFLRDQQRAQSPDADRVLNHRSRSPEVRHPHHMQRRQRSHSPTLERYIREQQQLNRKVDFKPGYHDQRTKTNQEGTNQDVRNVRTFPNQHNPQPDRRLEHDRRDKYSDERRDRGTNIRQDRGPDERRDRGPDERQDRGLDDRRDRGASNGMNEYDYHRDGAQAIAQAELRAARALQSTPQASNSPANYQSAFTPQELSNILYPSIHPQLAGSTLTLNQGVQDNNEPNLRVVVGYIGSIEMPSDSSLPNSRLQSIRSAIKRLRLEQKIHTLVLMEVFNDGVKLTNSMNIMVANYPADRLAFSGVCPDDKRFFGLVTIQNVSSDEISSDNGSQEGDHSSSSCHVFMVDPELRAHNIHAKKAKVFGFQCTHDPETNKCLEFPRSVTPILRTVAKLYRDRVGGMYDVEIARANAFADPNVAARRSNSNSSNSDSGLGFWRDDGSNGDRVYVVDMPQNYDFQRQPRWHLDRQAAANLHPEPGMKCYAEPGHAFRRVERRSGSNSTSPNVNTSTSSGGSPSHMDRLNVRARPDPLGLSPKTPSPVKVSPQQNPAQPVKGRAYERTRAKQLQEGNKISDIQSSQNQNKEQDQPGPSKKSTNKRPKPKVKSNQTVRQRPVSCPIENNPLTPEASAAGWNALDIRSMDLASKLSPRACLTPGPEIMAARTHQDLQTVILHQAALRSEQISNLSKHPVDESSDTKHASSSTNSSTTLSSSTITSAPPTTRETEPKKVVETQSKETHQREIETETASKHRQLPPVPAKPKPPVPPKNVKKIVEKFETDKPDERSPEEIRETRGRIQDIELTVRRLSMEMPPPSKLRQYNETSFYESGYPTSPEEMGRLRKQTSKGSFHNGLSPKKGSFSLHHSHESLAVSDSECTSQTQPRLVSASSVQSIASEASVHVDISKPEVGRVASWAVSFENLLNDKAGQATFTEFLKKEFSQENILFWITCEKFKKITDVEKLKNRAQEIFGQHLASRAPEPVNIDSSARKMAEEALENPTAQIFDMAQNQIFRLMKTDSYSRFLKCDLYRECMVAEMEGRPLPFPGEEASPRKEDVEKRKMKKTRSTSSAEDPTDEKRRRSLLPWGRGKGSKRLSKGPQDLDKDAAVKSSLANADLSMMSKEVSMSRESLNKDDSSSQGDNKENYKLCRVIMPDGATTVIYAKPGVTIRESLKPLCDKRGMSVGSIDVLQVGSEKTVDINKDVSMLGSKEIKIEMRALFRLDMPNKKCIGVKAKPTRSIREVFKPILHKYGFKLDNLAIHLTGSSVPLDPSLMVSTIENQRVVVQPVEDFAGSSRKKEWGGYDSKRVSMGKPPLPRHHSTASTSSSLSGSLEDMSARVFEDLVKGKGDKAPNFDELGVLDFAKNAKIEAKNGKENRNSGIFGLIRRNSAGEKGLTKPKIKDKSAMFSSQRNLAGKKKSPDTEDEKFFDLLSKVQSQRLDDQRGVAPAKLELPDFLKTKKDANSSSDKENSPGATQRQNQQGLQPRYSNTSSSGRLSEDSRISIVSLNRDSLAKEFGMPDFLRKDDGVYEQNLQKSNSQPSISSGRSSKSSSKGSTSSGDPRRLKQFQTFGSPGNINFMDASFGSDGIVPSHDQAEEYFTQGFNNAPDFNDPYLMEQGLIDIGLNDDFLEFSNSSSNFEQNRLGNSQQYPNFREWDSSPRQSQHTRTHSESNLLNDYEPKPWHSRTTSVDQAKRNTHTKGIVNSYNGPVYGRRANYSPRHAQLGYNQSRYSDERQSGGRQTPDFLNRTVVENGTPDFDDLDATLVAFTPKTPLGYRPGSVLPPPPSVLDGSLFDVTEANYPPPPPLHNGPNHTGIFNTHEGSLEEVTHSPYKRRYPRNKPETPSNWNSKQVSRPSYLDIAPSMSDHNNSLSDEAELGTDTEPANCSGGTNTSNRLSPPPPSTPSPTTHELFPSPESPVLRIKNQPRGNDKRSPVPYIPPPSYSRSTKYVELNGSAKNENVKITFV